MRQRTQHIHMIGIAGSGMCGIAEVLLNMGYKISGSDISENSVVRRLRHLGAIIYLNHSAENILGAHLVVRSSAINDENIEVIKARETGIAVMPRAEMLAEIMRIKYSVAVAGMHGKTTTTSLLATIFKIANLDPTVIIGGRLTAYGSNAFLGQGEYVIAEADESDGSFLCLMPHMSIITNIEEEHLNYYKDLDEIKDTFVRFANTVSFTGVNIVCGDDKNISSILPRINRPVVTYGFGANNTIRAEVVEMGLCSKFNVFIENKFFGEANLNHPGKHNILNALAAIGIAVEVGIESKIILEALTLFGGVGRRFEIKGEKNGVLVVDDYGHHPTEIKAVLSTARNCYPERRIVVAFQPHRYSRTQSLFADFTMAFKDADLLLLTEIYAASEMPIPGVNGFNLLQGIRQGSGIKVEFFENIAAIQDNLFEKLEPNDLLITLGAGSIWKVGMGYLHDN